MGGGETMGERSGRVRDCMGPESFPSTESLREEGGGIVTASALQCVVNIVRTIVGLNLAVCPQ